MSHNLDDSRPQIPAPQPIGFPSAALILMTAALWGGTPVAVSYSVDLLPPVAVSGLRFALAALFMCFWCPAEGSSRKLLRSERKWILGGGCLLFFQITFFTMGIDKSNSSHATLLINTFVFWIVAIEHLLLKTLRMNFKQTLGLAIAAGGVFLTFMIYEDRQDVSQADSPNLSGDLLLLASAAILAVKILYTQHVVKRMPPGRFILWHDIVGVLLFAMYTMMFEDFTKWSAAAGQENFAGKVTAATLGIAYQGILVAGLCFAIQAHLLRKHAAFQISIYSFSTPLFGLLFAFLLRNDPYSPWLPLSAVCVAIGIVLVNLESRKQEAANSITSPAAPATPAKTHQEGSGDDQDQPGDESNQADQ
ncbi:MAG: DMT family transporter [Pirellulaceae bacterium]